MAIADQSCTRVETDSRFRNNQRIVRKPFVLGGIGLYRLVRSRFGVGAAAAAYGSTLYVVNPFVADRYLAGHLFFLLAFALVPWALPRVEDLARGADLKAVDALTVAIVPRVPETKDAAGKVLPTFEVYLVFGDDGRLIEQRIVEMPVKKVGEIMDRTVRTFDSIRDPSTFILDMTEALDSMQANPQGLEGLAGMLQQVMGGGGQGPPPVPGPGGTA